MKHKGHWLGVGVVSGVAGFVLSLTPAIPPSASPSGEHGEPQRVVEAYGLSPPIRGGGFWRGRESRRSGPNDGPGLRYGTARFSKDLIV